MGGFVHIAAPTAASGGALTYSISDAQLSGRRGAGACVGCRAHVKLNGRSLVGLVVRYLEEPDYEPSLIKPIEGLLDASPALDADSLAFIEDVARYYRAPLGFVAQMSLPRDSLAFDYSYALRDGAHKRLSADASLFSLPDALLKALARAQRPMDAHQLRDSPVCAHDGKKPTLKDVRAVLGQFCEQGLIDRIRVCKTRLLGSDRGGAGDAGEGEGAAPKGAQAPEYALNASQQTAIDGILGQLGSFGVHLLHGVTGSGKTDVYLRCLEAAIGQPPEGAGAAPPQALVLVPEISLAPQLKRRIDDYLGIDAVISHYKIGNKLRAQAWRDARGGRARVVIGTRSSVFMPFANLRLMVIDEEHSPQYKQVEKACYHARDVAIWRAQRLGIAVVLGSATPSGSTWHNLGRKHYALASLPERVEGVALPTVRIIDLAQEKVFSGFSRSLLERMQRCLDSGRQVMIYHNSRGYAPALHCHTCQRVIPCRNCELALRLHQGKRGRDYLSCHRCLAKLSLDRGCPDCGGDQLSPVGISTQQLEQALASKFPQYGVIRLDSDSIPTNAALQAALRRIHDGRAQILAGTQMLIKGHHFPRVGLAVAVQPDSLLHSVDPFARERLLQDLVQLSGRSGRVAAGEVVIQTRYPKEPLYGYVSHHNHQSALEGILRERKAARMPPYRHLAIVRCSDARQERLLSQLEQVARQWRQRADARVELYAPVLPTVGYVRRAWLAQAWLLAEERQALGAAVDRFVDLCRERQVAKCLVDVDPVGTE